MLYSPDLIGLVKLLFKIGDNMIKNIERFLCVLLVFMPITVFGVDLESVDGIWQDKERKSSYYSIFQNENTIVMTDLKALEVDGSTLAATYVGSKDDLLLTPLAPRQSGPFSPDNPLSQIPIVLNFVSNNELELIIQCDLCGVVPRNLIKVFK